MNIKITNEYKITNIKLIFKIYLLTFHISRGVVIENKQDYK